MYRIASVTCLAIAAVVAIVASARRDDDSAAKPASTTAATTAPPPTATSTPTATPTPTPTATPLPAAGDGLAIGVTEPNPNLVAAPDARAVPAPWSTWRDALGAIRPAFYRLVIDWASIQPNPGAAADLSAPNAGCMRELQPCLGWFGVRDQLRALASRQREGGWQGLVVITGTPDWAAAPPSGCEREGTGPHSRPPRADALPAYQKLISDLLAVAAQEGADLRYWSAWNEPNHPAFISPQREACDGASPTVAAAPYAELVRALQQALATAGGDHRIVLGETAGLLQPTPRTTSVQEFIAALPEDVVCASTVWSQHAYIGGPDPVAPVSQALAARGCPVPQTIWITETGVGPAPSYLSGARAIADEQVGCRELHARLESWWNDPQVTVAFQYTFRQDDRFPTGLITTNLASSLPTLQEWTAWGGTREPTAPPPRPAC
jgi:hypothetical protein